MREALGPEFELLLERLAQQIADRVSERLIERQAVEHPSASPWMGVEQAAAYLDWPKQRLYKLSASGEIPHYKQDGRVLFRSDELDRWLSQFAEGERSEHASERRAIVAFDGNGDVKR